MRELLHRVGILEVTSATTVKTQDDHEERLRKLEYLTAKVVGGALVGSALGGWVLSNLGSCVQ